MGYACAIPVCTLRYLPIHEGVKPGGVHTLAEVNYQKNQESRRRNEVGEKKTLRNTGLIYVEFFKKTLVLLISLVISMG